MTGNAADLWCVKWAYTPYFALFAVVFDNANIFFVFFFFIIIAVVEIFFKRNDETALEWVSKSNEISTRKREKGTEWEDYVDFV